MKRTLAVRGPGFTLLGFIDLDVSARDHYARLYCRPVVARGVGHQDSVVVQSVEFSVIHGSFISATPYLLHEGKPEELEQIDGFRKV